MGDLPPDPYPPASGPRPDRFLVAAALLVVGGLVASLLFLGPLGSHTESAGGGGPRFAPLRAFAERTDDHTRLAVTGRVRVGDVPGPTTLVVLGRDDDRCPLPPVDAAARITAPPGSVAVGWRSVTGPAPGAPLPTGRRIRSTGDLDLGPRVPARLCVHLVHGGAAPRVLQTVSVAVPHDSGPMGSDEEGLLVLASSVLVAIGALVGLVRLVVIARRRAGPDWGLPALPPGLRVPDALPLEVALPAVLPDDEEVLDLGERRLPGPHGGPIDRLLVAPTGVLVVLRLAGAGRVDDEGRLWVDGHDETVALERLEHRRDLVAELLLEAGLGPGPVIAVIAVDAGGRTTDPVPVHRAVVVEAGRLQRFAEDGVALLDDDRRRIAAALSWRLPVPSSGADA